MRASSSFAALRSCSMRLHAVAALAASSRRLLLHVGAARAAFSSLCRPSVPARLRTPATTAAPALPPPSAPARTLFVKVHGNANAALDKLQAKSDLEGLERMTATRCRFVKPHLARQRAVSDAIYNRAKRERIRLVEEMVLDRKLVPF